MGMQAGSFLLSLPPCVDKTFKNLPLNMSVWHNSPLTREYYAVLQSEEDAYAEARRPSKKKKRPYQEQNAPCEGGDLPLGEQVLQILTVTPGLTLREIMDQYPHLNRYYVSMPSTLRRLHRAGRLHRSGRSGNHYHEGSGYRYYIPGTEPQNPS